MKKLLTISFVLLFGWPLAAQKIDSIYFNLYTDSLKKGVYNYINVDGKLKDGSFLPLMADEVTLSSTIGRWEGNSLILDTATVEDKVSITAVLKADSTVVRKTIIYLKKINIDPVLRSEKEVIESYKRQGKG